MVNIELQTITKGSVITILLGATLIMVSLTLYERSLDKLHLLEKQSKATEISLIEAHQIKKDQIIWVHFKDGIWDCEHKASTWNGNKTEIIYTYIPVRSADTGMMTVLQFTGEINCRIAQRVPVQGILYHENHFWFGDGVPSSISDLSHEKPLTVIHVDEDLHESESEKKIRVLMGYLGCFGVIVGIIAIAIRRMVISDQ